MKNNYIFTFKEVCFNTDDGDGEDQQVSYLLNAKYGRTVFTVRSASREEALKSAIEHLSEISGFKVLDVDYDLTIT